MKRLALKPGNAVSPIDGRYASKTEELWDIFSEQALMRYRLLIEVEYLIFFMLHIESSRKLSETETLLLQSFYLNFSEDDYNAIIKHEKTTNHDVKAVEYFMHDKLKGTSLEDVIGFVHIGRTSEDINNLAYAFMLRDGTKALINQYNTVVNVIDGFAKEHENTPMLALTHGQPASPTTFGWEMNVFSARINKYLSHLDGFLLLVKCNGATGGDNALNIAFPDSDWRNFSELFIDHLNGLYFPQNNGETIIFENNPFTTQIEPHDTYAELFGTISTLNTICLDFVRDMWLYISRGVILQRPVEGEVGSSAMPQKINPINFENAEGNFGMANAMFDFFRNKLPVSRMQRDLSDSTVERNFGSAYAHTLIALKAIKAGMKRVYVVPKILRDELDDSWEVVAEAYQVILRVNGIEEGYEMLKEVTCGKKVTKNVLHDFVEELWKKKTINPKIVNILMKVTPENYIGNRTF